MSSAIWKAIPSASPNAPRCRRRARAEQARGLEELPGLQRAALEVRLDGRIRVVRLAALHRLAAREAERGVGEQRDRARVAGRRQLGERPREQVVAGRPRGRRARRPTRPTRARAGTRRRRSGRRGRASPCARARPRRPRRRDGASSGAAREKKTSSGRSRLPPAASASRDDGGDEPAVRRDGLLEPLLELVEVRRRARASRGSSPARWSRGAPRCAARRSRPRTCGTGRRRSPTRASARRARPGRGSGARWRAGRCRPRRPSAPCRAAARSGRTRAR